MNPEGGVPSAEPGPVDAGVHNPSRFARRLPVAALALIGCAISVYLTAFQYGAIDTVWDPFFGDGSEKVLTSALSRALPVADAALGAGAYAFEAVVELSGRSDRWRTQPWWVLLVGLTATGLAVVSTGLVISQPLLTGTFCTLCLCSAGISYLVFGLVSGEVRAALSSYRTSKQPR